jgi:type I restriction enzyme, R subunit
VTGHRLSSISAKNSGAKPRGADHGEFQHFLVEIITADVFSAAKTLRGIKSFTRDDGTPLNYTLVNIKDRCKNSFEVVSQLHINTDYKNHAAHG